MLHFVERVVVLHVHLLVQLLLLQLAHVDASQVQLLCFVIVAVVRLEALQ